MIRRALSTAGLARSSLKDYPLHIEVLPKASLREGGNAMPTQRKIIDCRSFPSEKNCTIAISGTEEEVLELATHHASTVHGHANTPELREQIRSMLKDEAEGKAATA